ncbi:MAG: riboflavin biosynthesis protein RibF [Chloroflexi bacterium]|nr:riboflavin biosynthesis protein RibF [Chloroflexota bacterium]
MLLARLFSEISLDRPALLTIGTFDGVHRGHRYLLEQAHARATEHGYGLVIVTFEPCPAVVLRPALGRYQLTSAAQKLKLLEAVDPAVVAMLEFTPALSLLTAEEFMDALEAQVQLQEVWFGEDFRFGRDRGGDLRMLVERGRESGFSLHVVNRRTEDKASISSSRIRQAIAAGDVATAMPLLGYPFARECQEPQAGRWLDERTEAARCAVPEYLTLPADGIYAVLASQGDGLPRKSIAAISASDANSQMVVKGDVWADEPLTVEFIDRITSMESYLSDPAAWEARAFDQLGHWERPEYDPIGEY